MKNLTRRLLDDLPVEERVKVYRDLAKEALRRAEEAADSIRSSRVAEAAAWHALALEIERNRHLPLGLVEPGAEEPGPPLPKK